ncbi:MULTISPECIES: Atu2307/SP_0267 family LLM class monooxygenase [unclassified Pedobacter]|uniref:Atu2307/SP_0267 family LLM class monooxygenase n=1 Tax=unclassified Pedobacter TaxID=2628915 RepID=UPI00141F9460|nr:MULTISPECIES: Atu2307/SP_0267 family LLM class monooxygenase [unclassified Pedobacter]NII81633.1 putative LLM family oxidoreductase [Pedobacter sp. SG908]NMN35637.1 putative LLM family oxidoreductase [Pedobacter sp. SG918]
MELGIGMFGDLQINAKGEIQPAQQRLQEIIAEIKLMDEVGLDFYGIGEHHRPDYAVSSPEIILAAAAIVTKNIKLSSAVSVLSSSDPVKLYQNFATIDLISNGRAELMAGRGSFIESFPLFGYNLQDYDELYEEKLELLLKINAAPKITWKGKFRPELNNQEVLPRAVNDNLKIWVAVGGTPESVERAGRLGLPVMFAIIGGQPIQFKPLFDYYKRVYEAYGHDMSKFEVGVHMHALFGENSNEVADYYYPLYSAQMNRIGKSRGWPPYQRNQFDAGRSSSGALIIGDVNESVEKILAMEEIFGLTRFSAHMDVGGPSHAALMKSIELFGSKIAPKVREALKK